MKLVEYVYTNFFGRTVDGKTLKIRKGVEVALNTFDAVLSSNEPKLIVFSAPTGYGKSTMLPAIASYLANTVPHGIARLVHILPMRSMVEDIASRARKLVQGLGLELEVGAQCSSPLGSLKDPTFIRDYVVTTFDSYVLNLYKATVFLYTPYAHYEMPRAHIYTALNVFDEAHLFIDVGRPIVALTTSIALLLEAKLPAAILTATIPTHLIHVLHRNLLRFGIDSGQIINVFVAKSDPKGSFPKRKLSNMNMVEDSDWINVSLSVIYKTRLIKSTTDFLKEVHSLATTVRKTLVVENDPMSCIEVLKDVLAHGYRAIAIHGRMRSIDRYVLASRLKEFEGVVVATQVVEAGIDLDADGLATDSAPLPQLIQRLGRLCRDLERRSSNEECTAIIRFESHRNDHYGPYELQLVKQAVDTISLALEKYGENGILWRTPSYASIDLDSGRKATTYLRLLEHWADKVELDKHYTFTTDDEILVTLLKNIDSLVNIRSEDARDILRKLGSFVRDYPMISLILVKDVTRESFKSPLQRVVEELMLRALYEVEEYESKYGIKIFERDFASILMNYFSIPLDLATLRRKLEKIVIEDSQGSKCIAVLLSEEGTPKIHLEKATKIMELIENVMEGNTEKWFRYLDSLAEKHNAIPIGILAPWSQEMIVEGFDLPIGII